MNIELYNGDCLDVISSLDLSNVIIVSDPPFNIGYHYNTYKDKMPDDDYFKFLSGIFSKAPSVVIHYPESLYKLSQYMKLVPNKVVSWCYNSSLPRQHRDICFFNCSPDFGKVLQPYKNIKDSRIVERYENGAIGCRLYDWWNINIVKNVSKEKTKHPCQMPLEVMQNIVGMLPSGKTILDPFMGSGTTGVACVNLNRSFIGIELDKDYHDIAVDRIHASMENRGDL